jgi:hypothetical protein
MLAYGELSEPVAAFRTPNLRLGFGVSFCAKAVRIGGPGGHLCRSSRFESQPPKRQAQVRVLPGALRAVFEIARA